MLRRFDLFNNYKHYAAVEKIEQITTRHENTHNDWLGKLCPQKEEQTRMSLNLFLDNTLKRIDNETYICHIYKQYIILCFILLLHTFYWMGKHFNLQLISLFTSEVAYHHQMW